MIYQDYGFVAATSDRRSELEGYLGIAYRGQRGVGPGCLQPGA